jgi:hypothetical protein
MHCLRQGNYSAEERKIMVENEWKIIATLGEIQKNKSDVLKITRVSFRGKELVNLQVWRKNTETEEIFPLKDQKMSFNIELKDQVIEAISSAI